MFITCKGILFDLDGVLIDSTACIVRNWEKWAHRHKIDLEQIMRIAHGQRTIETMQAVAPHLDVAREAQAFALLEVSDTEGVVALPGALEILHSLQGARWGIVTSAERDLAVARLTAAGLPLPEALISGDDVSLGKPAPDPYLAGVKQLGCEAQDCVAVEDAPSGIQSARSAGLQVIAVTSTHPRHALQNPVTIDSLSQLKVNPTRDSTSPLVLTISSAGQDNRGS